jgi:hypothetical protein
VWRVEWDEVYNMEVCALPLTGVLEVSAAQSFAAPIQQETAESSKCSPLPPDKSTPSAHVQFEPAAQSIHPLVPEQTRNTRQEITIIC